MRYSLRSIKRLEKDHLFLKKEVAKKLKVNIWSDMSGQWLSKDNRSFTYDRTKAGVYTLEDAVAITRNWLYADEIWFEKVEAPQEVDGSIIRNSAAPLIDEVNELRDRNKRLELVAEKAEKLRDKLDEMFNDVEYVGIFSIAKARGIVYSGPNCASELSDLKTALEELNPEQQ